MPFMLSTAPAASSRGQALLSLPLPRAVQSPIDLESAASFRAQLLQQMACAPQPGILDSTEAAAGANGRSSLWASLLAMKTLRSDPPETHRQATSGGPGKTPIGDSTGPASQVQGSRQVRHSSVRRARALSRSVPSLISPVEVKAALPVSAPTNAATTPVSAAEGFLDKLAGAAKATAEALGLSPHLLLAQAALETGWGRKAIKDGTGQESYNLFGIKAGGHWTGKTVEATTTEYSHGVAQKKVESFRAYGSYAESFADYARLIQHRYGAALANGATAQGFGKALQAKGYATDPDYAQKIARVAQSVAYRLASRPTDKPETV